MANRDVYLTGLPRGGTTLACELLGGLPDCVALDEPLDGPGFLRGAEATRRRSTLDRLRGRTPSAAAPDHDRIVDNIVAFSREVRQSIREQGTARSKTVDGRVFGSKVADAVGPEGTRIKLAKRSDMSITKPLTDHFTLIAKHNSAFAGVLPELAGRAPVFALVRNPVSVLASWQTVPFAVNRGHATFAERFEPSLGRALDSIPDTMDRQVYLIGWFFGRFLDVLPKSSIVRYEDVVASDGRALAVVEPSAADLAVPLSSRNRAGVYGESTMRELGERLLSSDGAYWQLYQRQDVADLLSAGEQD